MIAEATLATGDVYVSTPLVEVAGQHDDLVQSSLIGMEMRESESTLSALELRFFNTATLEGRGNDYAFENADNDLLSIGRRVKVSAGDQNDPQEIFRGVITGLELVVKREQQPVLLVLAEDALQGARLTRRTRLHREGTVRSIVEGVATDLGLRTSIDGLSHRVDAQLQLNETDLAFLKRLLLAFDAELQMVGDELQVSPRADARRSEVVLELNSQLLDVRVLADVAHQVSGVTFAGWDFGAGREINVENDATADLGPGAGRTGAQSVEDAFGVRSEHLGHVAAQNRAEAQALVNAAYSRRARRFLRAEGTAVGNPGIRAGSHLTLRGLGPRFENTYYVTEARHRYDTEEGYLTEFRAECAFLGS